MATRKTAEKKTPVTKTETAKVVVPENTITKVEAESAEPVWDFKDRQYFLKGGKTPLTFRLKSKHSRTSSLLYFDKEKRAQRELRYATNMTSPFKDEQEGEVTLGHIVFVNGYLDVPKENIALQQLLSLYHPMLDTMYEEHKPEEEAIDEIEAMDVELEAAMMARDMDIEKAEAVLRSELGAGVEELSTKELKRDLRLFARRDPYLFLELAEDSDLELRNIAIKAVSSGLIALSSDQRVFSEAGSGRRIITVPFEENPYGALAQFFKTDEGISLYKSLYSRL